MATFKKSPKRIPRKLKDDEVEFLLNLKESDITSSLLYELFGNYGGKVKMNPYDYFTLPVGRFGCDIETEDEIISYRNETPIETGVGIFIFNKLFIESDLTPYVGYVNDNLTKKKFNKLMNNDLKYAVIEDRLDTETYGRFLNKTQFVMPLCTVISPCLTERFFECIVYIQKEKRKMLKKYDKEIKAGDVVAIEKMESELIKMAKDFLGDDPSMDIYTSGAKSNFENHFKNMYIMKGAIADPDPNASNPYMIATSCYATGISREEYEIIAKSLSAGPFKRAHKTQLGGDWEKMFGAALQHIIISEEDCGTDMGIRVKLTDKNMDKWMYSWILKSNGQREELTSQNKDQYINKTVEIMYPTMCAAKDGYCAHCVGGFAKLGGKYVGASLEKIPSKLKNISMKAFHDSTVSTHQIDVFRAFNYMNQTVA